MYHRILKKPELSLDRTPKELYDELTGLAKDGYHPITAARDRSSTARVSPNAFVTRSRRTSISATPVPLADRGQDYAPRGPRLSPPPGRERATTERHILVPLLIRRGVASRMAPARIAGGRRCPFLGVPEP
jgi:hypothetical protein